MAPVDQFQIFADRMPIVALLTAGSWYDDFWSWCMQNWDGFLQWASQRYVIAAALAWLITFILVCIVILGLGFGPAGVVAGTLAAAFQGAMYGAFTPAGGIFATLTSMAMLGTLLPAALIIAVIISTLVSGVVWWLGVGR